MTKTTLSNNELNDKQIIGNAGMYYVCYLLSQKGWNAMPTARNAKGIDIVAYSEDGKCITIQVKTFSKSKNTNITSFKEDEKTLWEYLFVVLLSDTTSKKRVGDNKADNPTIFVLHRSELLLKKYKDHICFSLTKRSHKNEQHLFDNVWATIENK